MDTERIKKYINSVKWVFARTMPQWPHEYTVREWRPDLDSEFVWFAETIRKYGYRERFLSTVKTYLKFSEHKYWTMGAPINKTIIINRTNDMRAYPKIVSEIPKDREEI